MRRTSTTGLSGSGLIEEQDTRSGERSEEAAHKGDRRTAAGDLSFRPERNERRDRAERGLAFVRRERDRRRQSHREERRNGDEPPPPAMASTSPAANAAITRRTSIDTIEGMLHRSCLVLLVACGSSSTNEPVGSSGGTSDAGSGNSTTCELSTRFSGALRDRSGQTWPA